MWRPHWWWLEGAQPQAAGYAAVAAGYAAMVAGYAAVAAGYAAGWCHLLKAPYNVRDFSALKRLEINNINLKGF